jgi:hypothetical protein
MQVLREMNGKKSNIIKINKSKPLFFVWKLKLETENKSIVLPWTPQLLSLFEYYCIYFLIGVYMIPLMLHIISIVLFFFFLTFSQPAMKGTLCLHSRSQNKWLYLRILAHEITLWNSCTCFLFYPSTYHPCLLKAIEPGSFL